MPLSDKKKMFQVLEFFWSFGFLSRLSTYVFITSCGINGNVYILQLVLDILNKLIYDSKNICGFWTMNEMHIESASLIICSINYNLTSISSALPPEVKKKNSLIYIVNLIILCTSKVIFIYSKFKNKTFNVFEAPNQHHCYAVVLRKFFPVLISLLDKWSI